MQKYLITNATIVNEGKQYIANILIEGEYIKQIEILEGKANKSAFLGIDNIHIIDATGKYLLPGVIDDHVHFREPGLTHKADIQSESRAAVAGGVTSYMEMPNTVPNVLTQDILEEKFQLASKKSLANYSFFLGASNANLDELLKTNPHNVCGIKVFIGSSTGNMMVNNIAMLEELFKKSPMLIAVHAEDEEIIQANSKKVREQYGDNPPMSIHPVIRNAEACYKASAFAVELAKKYNARLHICHLTTGIETELFKNNIPLKDKKITAEVCVQHLWFTDKDYDKKGALIKCNPAIKSQDDKNVLFNALLDNRIDVIATDHAPHTLAEKENPYFSAPSGMPMIQHALPVMLTFYKKGMITIEKIVEKMSHNPAVLYNIEKRGFIKEGYYADLVLVDMNQSYVVEHKDILYKCGWSPMEGEQLNGKVEKVFVNGHLAFDNGIFDESQKGKRLLFEQ